MKGVHHICIQTEKYAESVKFYTEILGFLLVKETANFHGRDYNSWLNLDGFMIELQTNKNGERLNEFNKNNKGIVHFCLMSEDIDFEYKRIVKLGFNDFMTKNGRNIYEVCGTKLLKLKAPEGTIVELRDKYEI